MGFARSKGGSLSRIRRSRGDRRRRKDDFGRRGRSSRLHTFGGFGRRSGRFRDGAFLASRRRFEFCVVGFFFVVLLHTLRLALLLGSRKWRRRFDVAGRSASRSSRRWWLEFLRFRSSYRAPSPPPGSILFIIIILTHDALELIFLICFPL